MSRWAEWARKLQAISQSGLHFTQDNPFEQERYAAVRDIAADIIAEYSNLTHEEIHNYNATDFGYATPKVDVRGIIFQDDTVLLVREIRDQGRWTPPGGWADVNDAPSEAVLREVREESGYDAQVVKLLAVYDREKQGHQPSFPIHVYKLFFLCEITGGEATPNSEADEIRFFPLDALPELSVSRITTRQLQHFYQHLRHPDAPTEFD
ncbi:MAG: NUDIX hydrolase [Candidatus Hydrogenedentota bacterium]